tara:strand:- start:5421 stop:6833 length:1413 start_codon:yes stop_codon:yes gene_type:complete
MAKKLGLLLAVGAVAGFYYLNQEEEDSSGDESDTSEDELVAATSIDQIESYTLKEYYENIASPSVNPFNKAGGGNFVIKGSSGEQYKWKEGNKQLYLNDDDGIWPFAEDSGAVHIKIAKGFAVDFKVTTENTNYLGDFDGLKEALANRQSTFKIVGASQGSVVQQTMDFFARLWKDDEMQFRLFEGDYISIDIDDEHEGIATFKIHVDGEDYNNKNGKVNDEVFIRVNNVFKVTPVDAWASETFMFDSENLVFNAGASIFRRIWLKVTSKIGTKGMKAKAKRELAELATEVGTTPVLKTTDNLVGVTDGEITDTAVDRVMRVRAGETVTINGKKYKGGQILPKGVVNTAAGEVGQEAIGWRWLQNFPIVRTSFGASALVGTVFVGAGLYDFLSDDLKTMIMGPSCESTCSGFEEGSDEMKDCLQECISNKDKRITMFGAGALLVGGILAFVVIDKVIPDKEKKTTKTAGA